MQQRADDALVVLVTAPDLPTADRLAGSLVGDRLAACVNLLDGVRSVYRWEGAVERGDEVLMVVKTTRERLADLEARIARDHPYEVPEVLALAADHVAGPYLGWLRGAVTSAPASRG